jgi:hypothetical protein
MRTQLQQAMDNTLDLASFDDDQLVQLARQLAGFGCTLWVDRMAYPERYVRRVIKAIEASLWCIASEREARGALPCLASRLHG